MSTGERLSAFSLRERDVDVSESLFFRSRRDGNFYAASLTSRGRRGRQTLEPYVRRPSP